MVFVVSWRPIGFHLSDLHWPRYPGRPIGFESESGKGLTVAARTHRIQRSWDSPGVLGARPKNPYPPKRPRRQIYRQGFDQFQCSAVGQLERRLESPRGNRWAIRKNMGSPHAEGGRIVKPGSAQYRIPAFAMSRSASYSFADTLRQDRTLASEITGASANDCARSIRGSGVDRRERIKNAARRCGCTSLPFTGRESFSPVGSMGETRPKEYKIEEGIKPWWRFGGVLDGRGGGGARCPQSLLSPQVAKLAPAKDQAFAGLASAAQKHTS